MRTRTQARENSISLQAFTLIELLVVIAIIAILTITVSAGTALVALYSAGTNGVPPAPDPATLSGGSWIFSGDATLVGGPLSPDTNGYNPNNFNGWSFADTNVVAAAGYSHTVPSRSAAHNQGWKMSVLLRADLFGASDTETTYFETWNMTASSSTANKWLYRVWVRRNADNTLSLRFPGTAGNASTFATVTITNANQANGYNLIEFMKGDGYAGLADSDGRLLVFINGQLANLSPGLVGHPDFAEYRGIQGGAANDLSWNVNGGTGKSSFSLVKFEVFDAAPPTVLANPQPQTNTAGSAVSFTAGFGPSAQDPKWYRVAGGVTNTVTGSGSVSSTPYRVYTDTGMYSTITLTNISAADEGNYFCSMRNESFGSTTSAAAYLHVILPPPAAASNVLTRQAGQPAQISVKRLLANDSDGAAGHLVSFRTVDARSTNGAVVSYIASTNFYLPSYVSYTPVNADPSNDVPDAFNYTIEDTQSQIATGTVLVAIAPANTNQGFNITGISSDADQIITVHLAGTSNQAPLSYAVEAATNLFLPFWVPVGTSAAAASSLWDFVDSDATNHASRFYRPGRWLRLEPGPYLLLDDWLIERSSNVLRKVNRPVRDLSQPIVTGVDDNNNTPYVSVIRDPQSGRYRMWYNAIVSSVEHFGYLESVNGINWIRPRLILADPAAISFGVSVIDEGLAFADPSTRYKIAWYRSQNQALRGEWIAHSSNGTNWTASVSQPVLAAATGVQDIVHLARDPSRNRYLMIMGFTSYPEDGYIGGTQNSPYPGYRRCVGQSKSTNALNWSTPRRIFKPDDEDAGITEFYSVGGVVSRGSLLIGLLKVLRDDLPATVGGPTNGIGYTVLAWSHDGENWQRDREPFFDRNYTNGTWDHAMAWMDCQLPVGDDMFIYYGGYASGHKPNPTTERQLGLVRLKRDRYVAREAGDAEGTLRTRLVQVGTNSLAINADASAGSIRVRVLDERGEEIPGFGFADCLPVTGDSLAAPIQWTRPLAEIAGQPIRLEFLLKNARLFALMLQ